MLLTHHASPGLLPTGFLSSSCLEIKPRGLPLRMSAMNDAIQENHEKVWRSRRNMIQ
ncbi:unnamed protein product, partial [Chrysoparadoxa australica]